MNVQYVKIKRCFLSMVLMTLLSISINQNLNAQVENANLFLEEQQVVQLITESGTSYEGVIIIVLADKITIQTTDGAQVTIAKSKIKSLSAIQEGEIIEYDDGDEINDQPTGTDYYFANPMPNRNFITETAIGIEQGKGFYQNVMVFLNSFGYGVTDHFSVSGGFESISLFVGDRPGFFVQPKYTFTERNSNVHLAVGANFIVAPGSGSGFVGTVYSAATLGDLDQNLTVGVAVPFTSDDLGDNPVFFQVGGQYRISKSFGFVSDNIIVPSEGVAYSLLGRIMKGSWSVDIGFASITGSSGAAPILGVNLQIGK